MRRSRTQRIFADAPVYATHLVRVDDGEDIIRKIESFFEGQTQGTIWSCSGSISTVTIGSVTYQGHFIMYHAAGTCSYESGIANRRPMCNLYVTLGCLNGSLIDGCVGGAMIAAGTVEVIIGSYGPGPRRFARS